MFRLFDLVVHFRRDERGAFAVIFGVVAIVMVALGGAVVDYVGIEQARSRAQIALDAAALALQSRIYSTSPTNKADIKTAAQALLTDRLGLNSGVIGTVLDVQMDVEAGALYLHASMSMPTSFVRLVGVPSLSANIESEAVRKKLELEIAFVLDNSGSMTQTGAGTNGTRQRIQFLRDAAKCAVNILFYKDTVNSSSNPDTCVPATGAQKMDDVSIGLVPFTMFVNVGASNQSASWMDKGSSVIANDNFDTGHLQASVVNRFDLFSGLKTSWDGCVEARPHVKTGSKSTEYLDTDDTPPTSGNTLFVPMLSPDIAETIGGNSYVGDRSDIAGNAPAICDRPVTNPATTCQVVESRTGCNSTYSNGGTCNTITQVSATPTGPVNFTSSLKYPNGYYGAHSQSCSCRSWTATSSWTRLSGSNNNQTFTRTLECTGGGYVPLGLTDRQMQERICKYYGPLTTPISDTRGPNADCGNSTVLPLTTTPATITTAITNMAALGGTNIHEGTAWGFRVLSPTEPFTQGAAYSEKVAKVMIIMTDGENTAYNLSPPNYCDNTKMRAYNGSCFNSAYGFPYNSRNSDTSSSSTGTIERLGPRSSANGSIASPNAELVTAMNERTLQTCANAKAQGIVVYTIGLATAEATQSTRAVVEDMLTKCASSTDKARFPQEPSELKSIFQAIANDLTQLRIAK